MSSRWPANRVRALFGLEHPIVQAGMVYNSGGRLAAAAAEAGCLGLIGAGWLRPDDLRAEIRLARSLTAKPLGVNLPLLYGHIGDCLEAALADALNALW